MSSVLEEGSPMTLDGAHVNEARSSSPPPSGELLDDDMASISSLLFDESSVDIENGFFGSATTPLAADLATFQDDDDDEELLPFRSESAALVTSGTSTCSTESTTTISPPLSEIPEIPQSIDPQVALNAVTPPSSTQPVLKPPPRASTGFANAYLQVFPNSGKVVMPKQVLSYQGQEVVVEERVLSASEVQAYLPKGQPIPRGIPPETTLGSLVVGRPDSHVAPVPPLPMPPAPLLQVAPMLQSSVQPLERFQPTMTYSNAVLQTAPPPTPPLPNNKSPNMKPLALPPKPPKKRNDSSTPTVCPQELPPARPLSAYNFFYSYERERMLADDFDEHQPPDWESWDTEFQHQLLRKQWSRDRTVKRKHRKSHGRYTFHALSKGIAKTWKSLPEQAKDVFRQVAAQDFQRYSKEVTERKIAESASNATSKGPPPMVANCHHAVVA